ncbi:MAG: twin-arginine translocase TatA/TatE family subunit [Actinomycetia bacterium]|nr:twin-arginine translocase TatA/TatE family subunit [Actinomycetes bacterium]
MGSLGSGELIVIAIVALVVFGPKRLPELAKKAGELLAQARSATRTLTNAMDSEYSDISAPLQTLKAEYDLTMNEIKNVGSTVTGMAVTLPGEEVGEEAEDSGQQTADGRQEEAEEDGRQQTTDDRQEEAEEDGRQQTTDDRQEEEAEETDSRQPSAISEEEGEEQLGETSS